MTAKPFGDPAYSLTETYNAMRPFRYRLDTPTCDLMIVPDPDGMWVPGVDAREVAEKIGRAAAAQAFLEIAETVEGSKKLLTLSGFKVVRGVGLHCRQSARETESSA